MQPLSLMIAALLCANVAAAAAEWQKPPVDVASTGNDRTVFYFRSEGTVLCREVEEDVWTDPRVQTILDGKAAYRIDADDPAMQAYLRRFKVFMVPTVVVVDGGNEVARLVRNASREDYLRLLNAKPGDSIAPKAAAARAPAPSSGQMLVDASMVSVADPKGDAPSPEYDIVNLAGKVDATALKVVLTMASGPSSRLAAYNLFIDYDGDAFTGYSIGRLEGIDYLVQGNQLNQFQGKTQTEWNWAELRLVSCRVDGPNVVFELPIRSDSVANFQKARLYAQTQDDQWATVDEAPPTGSLVVRP